MVAFAYIALGVPAAVLWWNIALQVRALQRSRGVAGSIGGLDVATSSSDLTLAANVADEAA